MKPIGIISLAAILVAGVGMLAWYDRTRKTPAEDEQAHAEYCEQVLYGELRTTIVSLTCDRYIRPRAP